MSTTLATRNWGADDHARIVLLHGFMGSADDWEPVAERLADRFRVTAVDLPGHGRSIGLPEDAYTPDGLCGAVRHTLGPGEPRILVGYSMGGRLAYRLAIEPSSPVRALVAESAHPGLASDAERADRLAADRERAVRLVADPRGFLEAWYRAPMFGPVAGDPERRERLIARRLDGDPEEWARALVGMSTGRQEPVGERLRAKRVPTLLVAGALDSRYVGILESAAGRIGAGLHVEPDAGHAVHLDRPGAFADAVATFIQNTIQHHPPCP